jgi:hypothetical protein
MFILAKDLNKEFLILIKPILDFPPKLIMHNFYVYEMHRIALVLESGLLLSLLNHPFLKGGAMLVMSKLPPLQSLQCKAQ